MTTDRPPVPIRASGTGAVDPARRGQAGAPEGIGHSDRREYGICPMPGGAREANAGGIPPPAEEPPCCRPPFPPPSSTACPGSPSPGEAAATPAGKPAAPPPWPVPPLWPAPLPWRRSGLPEPRPSRRPGSGRPNRRRPSRPHRRPLPLRRSRLGSRPAARPAARPALPAIAPHHRRRRLPPPAGAGTAVGDCPGIGPRRETGVRFPGWCGKGTPVRRCRAPDDLGYRPRP
jgi:hypothetical protein